MKQKELSTTQGTIAYCLNKEANLQVIDQLLNQGKLYEAKVATINIVDADPDLKTNPQVSKFKAQILKAQGMSHFTSILATYMTGCKVS